MSIKIFCIAVLKRQRTLFVLGGALMAGLTSIYAASSLVTNSRVDSSAMSASRQPTASHSAQESSSGVRPMGPVQVVRLTLYDVGIVPQQSYAQAGLVTIAVEDLSGGTTGVIVERDDDGQPRVRVGEVGRKENKRHGRQQLRLNAGHYRLYMADRPENRAELIVEP